MHANNHLCSSFFFSQYETHGTVSPALSNAVLLEDLSISLEELLEGETAAMTLPLDAQGIWTMTLQVVSIPVLN